MNKSYFVHTFYSNLSKYHSVYVPIFGKMPTNHSLCLIVSVKEYSETILQSDLRWPVIDSIVRRRRGNRLLVVRLYLSHSSFFHLSFSNFQILKFPNFQITSFYHNFCIFAKSKKHKNHGQKNSLWH